MSSERYVIIGNSAAGIFGAEAIRQADPAGEITIISEEEGPAYSRCLTTYYLAGNITADGLDVRAADFYHKNNISLLDKKRAVKLDSSAKIVEITEVEGEGDKSPFKGSPSQESSTKKIPYDRLLIATGAGPVKPCVPNIDLPGVFTLRTKADALAIEDWLQNASSAVVLGDGLVGLMTAIALKKRGLNVNLAGIAPHVMAHILDEDGAELVHKKLAANGISLHLQQSVTEIRGAKGRVQEVVLNNGTTLPAELMVVAIGVKPHTEWLPEAMLASDGSVQIDEFCATPVEGIYAAGDVTSSYDPIRQSPQRNPLWVNASRQGQVAGRNMAGVTTELPGVTNMNSANIFDLHLVTAGISNTPPGGETYLYSPHDGANYVKLIFTGEKLAGFVLIGKATRHAGLLNGLLGKQGIKKELVNQLNRERLSYHSLLK